APLGHRAVARVSDCVGAPRLGRFESLRRSPRSSLATSLARRRRTFPFLSSARPHPPPAHPAGTRASAFRSGPSPRTLRVPPPEPTFRSCDVARAPAPNLSVLVLGSPERTGRSSSGCSGFRFALGPLASDGSSPSAGALGLDKFNKIAK